MECAFWEASKCFLLDERISDTLLIRLMLTGIIDDAGVLCTKTITLTLFF